MSYLNKDGLTYLWSKITNKLSGYVKTDDMKNTYGIEETTVPTLKDLSNPVANSLDYWGIEINELKNRFTDDGKYHKVIGSVDLGALEWLVSGTTIYTTDIASVVAKVSSDSEVANIKCSKYPTVSRNTNLGTDKTISLNAPGSICVYDSSYNDATAFKNAMQGQILYYELATPVDEVVKVATNEEISKINENAVTLGYSGKNLLKPADTLNCKISGNTYTNTLADDISNFRFQIYFMSDGGSQYPIFSNTITTTGYHKFEFTPNEDGKITQIRHNGSRNNIIFFYNSEIRLEAGKKYNISMNVSSANPSTINGLVVSDLMLRPASITDDTYEPYKPSVDERLNSLEYKTATQGNSLAKLISETNLGGVVNFYTWRSGDDYPLVNGSKVNGSWRGEYHKSAVSDSRSYDLLRLTYNADNSSEVIVFIAVLNEDGTIKAWRKISTTAV